MKINVEIIDGIVTSIVIDGSRWNPRQQIHIQGLSDMLSQIVETFSIIQPLNQIPVSVSSPDEMKSTQSNEQAPLEGTPWSDAELRDLLFSSTRGQSIFLELLATQGKIHRNDIINNLIQRGVISPEIEHPGKFIAGITAGLKKRKGAHPDLFIIDPKAQTYEINKDYGEILKKILKSSGITALT